MENKVLVFSDCYIYGGSERLMSFLLRNDLLRSEYELSFAFRKHEAYYKGMQKDFSNVEATTIPVTLLSNDTLFFNFKRQVQSRYLVLLLKVPFLILYYSGIYSLFNSVVLIRLLLSVQPDILHVNNGGFPAARTANLLVFISRLLGVKRIVYQVNNQAQKPRAVDKFRNNLLGKLVSRFVTSSKMAKASLVTNVKIKEDRVSLIRNIVKLDPPLLSREVVLKDLNLKDDTFIMVQVAFLTKRKGQINLLRSISELKRNAFLDRDICLLLIGDGEDRFELEQFCAENRLDENVRFLGYQSNYPEYINAADIVVLPSIMNEDLPLVIIESLMLGKCILSTSLAGISEVIVNRHNGILISPDLSSIERALSYEIRWLMENPQEIRRIGQNALIESAIFSDKVYGETLNRVYKGC